MSPAKTSIFSRIRAALTGKDDVERIAGREDIGQLNAYLKTRPLWFPKRPTRFLAAATFTQEQLTELLEEESRQLGDKSLNLWILEIDGNRRLPAFSSEQRMKVFSARMSKDLNQVFVLGCVETLLADIVEQMEVDFVDLNLFSPKSWEIGVATKRSQ
jgi:hypothetical protein